MVLHFARNIQNLAIFCKKTDNKLTTSIRGEGGAPNYQRSNLLSIHARIKIHNCDFWRKFEKTQELDDALRRWLGEVYNYRHLCIVLTFGCSSKHSKNFDDTVRDEVLKQQRDLTDLIKIP